MSRLDRSSSRMPEAGDDFLHRTGHGPGTGFRAPPCIAAASQTVPDESMDLSIASVICPPDRFAVRQEEIPSDLPRPLHGIGA